MSDRACCMQLRHHNLPSESLVAFGVCKKVLVKLDTVYLLLTSFELSLAAVQLTLWPLLTPTLYICLGPRRTPLCNVTGEKERRVTGACRRARPSQMKP